MQQVERALIQWARQMLVDGVQVDAGGRWVHLDYWQAAVLLGSVQTAAVNRASTVGDAWAAILAGRRDPWLKWAPRLGAVIASRMAGTVVWKAEGERYVKRIPQDDGSYRYAYAAHHQGGVDAQADMVVGAAFAYQGGHLKLTAVDGDTLTAIHDETGEVVSLTRDGLSAVLRAEHHADLREHRAKLAQDASDAREFGTDSQASNLQEQVDALAADPAPWLTDREREAWRAARLRAARYVTKIAESSRDQVQDLVARAVEGGWSKATLRRYLEAAFGAKSRDWRRVAVTELQGAYNEGVVVNALDTYGDAARVARVPEADACPHCLRVFLGEDGRPIVWPVKRLLANGSNVGRRAREWRATMWPVHPNCRCDTVLIPPGTRFNDDWRLVGNEH